MVEKENQYLHLEYVTGPYFQQRKYIFQYVRKLNKIPAIFNAASVGSQCAALGTNKDTVRPFPSSHAARTLLAKRVRRLVKPYFCFSLEFRNYLELPSVSDQAEVVRHAIRQAETVNSN